MDRSTISDKLVALIRGFGDDRDEEASLTRIIEVVVDEIPGAEYAGVTIVDDKSMVTYAPSDELVRRVDLAQYDAKEGPCLTAAEPGAPTTVVVQDLQIDDRWPEFARRAVALGIRSMKCFHLFTEQHAVGALNLYARQPRAFEGPADPVGDLIAAHAAATMATHRMVANLQQAINTRDVIGQAKGILMERHRINADQAFQLLIALSQQSHRKLREVAEELTLAGAVDDRSNSDGNGLRNDLGG